jgi:hypothetical protein
VARDEVFWPEIRQEVTLDRRITDLNEEIDAFGDVMEGAARKGLPG